MSILIEEVSLAAVTNVTIDEKGRHSRTFRFPAGFVGFGGHFPDQAILPGVVQLVAAQNVAQNGPAADKVLKRVENAKFLLRIGPKEDVCVSCRFSQKGNETVAETRVECNRGVAALFNLVYSTGSEES
ncbi:MAG: hypothetical protein GX751_08805 [Desulfuromonadaceae bacterium]|nr:hypothetical protein [Desulfuromonadaceae bacterium]